MALKIVDLTHIVESGMPVYPGSEPVVVTQLSSISRDTYNELRLKIPTHAGTHIDCGYHLISGGLNTLTTPVDHFYGSAMTIDCSHLSPGGIITSQFLRPFGSILQSSDFILLHTGWSRFWGLPEYYGRFPVLDEEAASYLASFSLKGIGCDAISFDPMDSVSFPVHHIFLSSGMILVENLDNLANLPGSGFAFSCLPLRIKDGDGSPVRAVGIVEE